MFKNKRLDESNFDSIKEAFKEACEQIDLENLYDPEFDGHTKPSGLFLAEFAPVEDSLGVVLIIEEDEKAITPQIWDFKANGPMDFLDLTKYTGASDVGEAVNSAVEEAKKWFSDRAQLNEAKNSSTKIFDDFSVASALVSANKTSEMTKDQVEKLKELGFVEQGNGTLILVNYDSKGTVEDFSRWDGTDENLDDLASDIMDIMELKDETDVSDNFPTFLVAIVRGNGTVMLNESSSKNDLWERTKEAFKEACSGLSLMAFKKPIISDSGDVVQCEFHPERGTHMPILRISEGSDVVWCEVFDTDLDTDAWAPPRISNDQRFSVTENMGRASFDNAVGTAVDAALDVLNRGTIKMLEIN